MDAAAWPGSSFPSGHDIAGQFIRDQSPVCSSVRQQCVCKKSTREAHLPCGGESKEMHVAHHLQNVLPDGWVAKCLGQLDL